MLKRTYRAAAPMARNFRSNRTVVCPSVARVSGHWDSWFGGVADDVRERKLNAWAALLIVRSLR
ncbi:Uncharacterised protein [Mycobacteroides abscessus subsp. bolletii]|nr:Uncharacterised protein [Mycobacteroides abscessus]SKF62019.1 Uncharacterised protein [Mycobacteroides abscessus subsp. bolletii]SKH91066.1 Uncharacterised protein [Mycobacteroides abscessus subsp. bolletii]